MSNFNFTEHHLTPITPDDSAPVTARGLWINVGGDLNISLSAADEPVTLTVPSGVHLPYPLVAGLVMATGTTASGIVAITS